MRTSSEYYVKVANELLHEIKGGQVMGAVGIAINEPALVKRCVSRIHELEDAGLWAAAIALALQGHPQGVRYLIANPPKGDAGPKAKVLKRILNPVKPS